MGWQTVVILISLSLIPAVLISYYFPHTQLHTTNKDTRDIKSEGNEKTAQKKPNVIFIMLDDVGFNDIGWNNHEVQTPYMEELARSGVILNRNYVNAICSPSRSEFLTAKYAHRLGVTLNVESKFRQIIFWYDGSWGAFFVILNVIPANKPGYLPLGEKLLGERFQELGYSTHLLGKWHVGHCRPELFPTNRGFDTFSGTWLGFVDSYSRCYTSPGANDSAHAWMEGNKPDYSRRGMHVTDIIKEKALEILQQKTDKPLFLVLSFPAPHSPLQVHDKYVSLYNHIKDEWRKVYLGMITHVDDAVREVVEKLKDINEYDNTIIAMTSDNGGEYSYSSNYPLRGGKCSQFEGGHRVPGFISGPKYIIRKRNHISDENFHITDWGPTLISMSKGKVDVESEELDGLDQSTMICEGEKTSRKEVVYVVMPMPGTSSRFGAISYGDYKLIVGGAGLVDGWTQHGGTGLRFDGNTLLKREYMQPPKDSDIPGCDGSYGVPYNITLNMEIFKNAAAAPRDLLFNIRDDPEERLDLSEAMPEKVIELKARFDQQVEREHIFKDARNFSPKGPYRKDGVWTSNWC